ncbi:hypothetical protein SteCoe_25632 [Stentor coeruleus]|uniref:Importin subunit alpha n=1 Tax=Stentor coeruleus TaxID=5963 RepID=A0A1R2BEU3_9CILI|nr:hypothetical protein SteCoe_25632 [Stentor coeruleus]
MIYTSERIEMRNSKVLKATSYEKSDSFAVELRKKKRRDAIINKRIHKSIDTTNLSIEEIHFKIDKYSAILSTSIPDFNTISQILESFRNFSCMSNAPFLKMVSSGIIYYLQAYTNKDVPIELLKESTWIICNLTSGPSIITSKLIENGYLKKMIDLIELNNDDIVENTIIFIGNVAGESIENCKAVLNSLFFQKIEYFFSNKVKISVKMIENLLHTFNIICAKNLLISGTIATVIFNFLSKIKGIIDIECLHASWLKILSRLADSNENYRQMIIEKDLLKNIFNYLFFNSVEIQCSAIKILGTMMFSNNYFIDLLIVYNILDNFLHLIASPCQDIRKEAYWALSNMTAGKTSHVNTFVWHPICKSGFKGLIDIDINTKIEASWLYSNIGRKGCSENVILLVENNILEYLAEALKEKNEYFIRNIVEIIKHIFISAANLAKKEIFIEFVHTGCYDALIAAEYIAEDNISLHITNMLKKYDKYFNCE